MIKRFLAKHLKRAASKHPIVAVTGPRQSGKTTLAKQVFSAYSYVSLEDPDVRKFAEDDPRGFLSTYGNKVILDEIQRVPELFSYLQTDVDNDPTQGRFIITGSQQFLMSQKISQSLAGRSAILRLLPLSLSELSGNKSQTYWNTEKIAERPKPKRDLYRAMFEGFYPRVHDKELDPKQWYRDYFESYITRDVRGLLDIGDLRGFEQFIRLLAGRSGQMLNLSSLGNDSGVSHTTAKRWISILEASYIIFLLPPHFKNFHKRIIKAPKLYFLDPGLLCYLLRISSHKSLPTHSQLGAVFETFIISEIYKSYTHQGLEAPLYFWRDKSGMEIDLIIDKGEKLFPVEIKASQTISSAYLKVIGKWLKLPGNTQKKGALIFGGEKFQNRENAEILPWYAAS
ncbi:MAG: ATP-binding protein [Candidatus Margulisiibacteriota bacterium]